MNGIFGTLLLICVTLTIARSGWFEWPVGGPSDSSVKSVLSSYFDEPPSVYCYPHPTFVEDIVLIVINKIIIDIMSREEGKDIIDWIEGHKWIYAVIGGVALILVALLVASIVVCCFCCRKYRKKNKKGDQEQLLGKGGKGKGSSGSKRYGSISTSQARQPTAEERRRQREIEERNTASRSVKSFVKVHKEKISTPVGDEPGETPRDFIQPDMGSRMQKYWFKVHSDGKEMLITAAPVSQKCPLRLDLEMLRGVNKLLGALKHHPYLHSFEEISFDYDLQQVVIMQPYMPSGSLKDVIYKVSPTTDWSRKYSRRNRGLPLKDVRRYGRQILEAMSFLYDRGFPVLGHVQSGNIFVTEDGNCLLGGYENTLLGYKTRLYRVCRNYLPHFDVIMFGHLLFEMSCGYELTQLRPAQADYNATSDSSLKEIFDFIFVDGFTNTIEKIKNHHFFSVDLPDITVEASQIELTDHMKKVLTKVGKNKARQQPTNRSAAEGGLVGKIKQEIKKLDKEEPPSQPSTTSAAVDTAPAVAEKSRSASIKESFNKLTRRRSQEKLKVPEGSEECTVNEKES